MERSERNAPYFFTGTLDNHSMAPWLAPAYSKDFVSGPRCFFFPTKNGSHRIESRNKTWVKPVSRNHISNSWIATYKGKVCCWDSVPFNFWMDSGHFDEAKTYSYIPIANLNPENGVMGYFSTPSFRSFKDVSFFFQVVTRWLQGLVGLVEGGDPSVTPIRVVVRSVGCHGFHFHMPGTSSCRRWGYRL